MRLYLSSYRAGSQPQAWLDLLKGKKRVAVIANAVDFRLPTGPDNRVDSVQKDFDELRGLGLEPSEIDLRDYFGRPDTTDLAAELAKYDGLYVRGGNCFILRRALAASGADHVIADLLQRDVLVYAGFSAGIDMLVPSLHGVELVDDPHQIPEGYDSEIIWDCLGLLPYWVAPHYRSEHPETGDIEKSVQYMIDEHMPFIALRDGQAIVVDGDSQRVVG